MASIGFFNGVSPSLWYSHILYNQLFGTKLSPTSGMPDYLPSPGSANKTASAQISALNGLYERQYNLLREAEELSTANTDSVFYRQAAASSDESVAEISYFNSDNYEGEVPDSTFEIDVTSLAQEQINLGTILDPADSPPAVSVGENTFSLTVGSDIYNLSLEVDSFETNESVLTRLANEINEAEAGVTATVLAGTGGSRLQLVGETGADNSFSLADTTGDAVTATGINTVDQTASDAVFTVDGTPYEQQNNNLFLLDGKLEVELKSAGATEVTISPDTEAMSDQISSFVESLNDFTAYLASNQYLKPSLASSWQRLVSNAASDLSGYGLDAGSSYQLTLNSTTLAQALADDPTAVRDAFGGQASLVSDVISFSDRVLSSPGSMLLESTANSGSARLYLRSLTSSPRFRQGTALFWQVV